ncbi:MAG: polymerase sigma factor RpoE [Acidimicrobiales bacterium]|nr:polymerase sigma factor RpoE [Acidimicrobiales bacterium]
MRGTAVAGVIVEIFEDARCQSTRLTEADSFDAIFRRFGPRASRLAFRLTQDRAAAEDVSQEAFLRVLKNLDQFDRSRPMWPWLRTIVTNVAIDYQRSRARLDVMDPADQALPEEGYIRSEDRRALIEALSRVPARQRAALALRYLEDWDTKQASEFFGLSIPALEQLLFRARARLRREYERAGSGLRTVVGPAAVRTAARVTARLRRLRSRLHEHAARFGVIATSALANTLANAALVATMLTVVGATQATALATAQAAPSLGPASWVSSATLAVAPSNAGSAAGRATSVSVVAGNDRSLVTATASGRLSRTDEKASLNGQLLARVGKQPAIVDTAPWIYCDSPTRQQLCDAVDRVPPIR